jgi:hypothetical protein
VAQGQPADLSRGSPRRSDPSSSPNVNYERFAEILLCTEVNARESHGGEGRLKTARFALPTRAHLLHNYQNAAKLGPDPLPSAGALTTEPEAPQLWP